MPDPAATTRYAATVAGVRALLPETPITDGTNPSAADVGDALDRWEARVARKVGDLTAFDDDVVADFLLIAADVVTTFAASVTEDANHPERLPDEDRYAAVLWKRAQELLADLLTDVAEARGEEGVDDPEAPIGSFPEPSGITAMEF